MRIFISYSRYDKERAEDIAAKLRNSGAEVFVDYQRLRGGENFPERLASEIEKADAVVFLLSTHSANSTWVRDEIQYARTKEKQIIPANLDSTTLPSSLFFLCAVEKVDFTIQHNDQQGRTSFRKLLDSLGMIEVSERTDDKEVPTHSIPSTPSKAVQILPPPFGWCEIPAGMVSIEGTNFSIARSFHMGKYPITESQYQKFIESPIGYEKEAWWNFSADALKWRGIHPKPSSFDFQGIDLPRTNVTWYEAVAFCRWFSNELGYEVRLPTEQEWQRAAQGDDERKFPWGNRFDYSLCNIRADTLTPVTRYPNGASPYGVMDMAGNICEWCLSKWETPPGTDYSLTGDSQRVLRGYPCYGAEYAKTKVTYRVVYEPGSVNNANGFRIVTQFES